MPEAVWVKYILFGELAVVVCISKFDPAEKVPTDADVLVAELGNTHNWKPKSVLVPDAKFSVKVFTELGKIAFKPPVLVRVKLLQVTPLVMAVPLWQLVQEPSPGAPV
jgi:hypothetical protein